MSCQTDLINMGWPDILLGVVLDVGTVVSNIPQVYLIHKLKTGRGLNPHTICCGNMAQVTGAANAIILKFRQILLCRQHPLGCQPSLLDLYQLVVLWMSFFAVYVSYLMYFPGNKESQAVRRRWLFVRIEMFFFVLFALTIFGISIGFSLAEPCTTFLVNFASALGIMSSLFFSVTYVPQVFTTYFEKGSGALSLPSYLLQVGGGYILLYFQMVSNHEQWSTWLPNASATSVQAIVFAMALFYDIKARRAGTKSRKSESLHGEIERESRRSTKSTLSPIADDEEEGDGDTGHGVDEEAAVKRQERVGLLSGMVDVVGDDGERDDERRGYREGADYEDDEQIEVLDLSNPPLDERASREASVAGVYYRQLNSSEQF